MCFRFLACIGGEEDDLGRPPPAKTPAQSNGYHQQGGNGRRHTAAAGDEAGRKATYDHAWGGGYPAGYAQGKAAYAYAAPDDTLRRSAPARNSKVAADGDGAAHRAHYSYQPANREGATDYRYQTAAAAAAAAAAASQERY